MFKKSLCFEFRNACCYPCCLGMLPWKWRQILLENQRIPCSTKSTYNAMTMSGRNTQLSLQTVVQKWHAGLSWVGTWAYLWHHQRSLHILTTASFQLLTCHSLRNDYAIPTWEYCLWNKIRQQVAHTKFIVACQWDGSPTISASGIVTGDNCLAYKLASLQLLGAEGVLLLLDPLFVQLWSRPLHLTLQSEKSCFGYRVTNLVLMFGN